MVVKITTLIVQCCASVTGDGSPSSRAGVVNLASVFRRLNQLQEKMLLQMLQQYFSRAEPFSYVVLDWGIDLRKTVRKLLKPRSVVKQPIKKFMSPKRYFGEWIHSH